MNRLKKVLLFTEEEKGIVEKIAEVYRNSAIKENCRLGTILSDMWFENVTTYHGLSITSDKMDVLDNIINDYMSCDEIRMELDISDYIEAPICTTVKGENFTYIVEIIK